MEEDKRSKLRDVEFWNRALREEEKKAIEKYAKEHGDKEMELIQQSILAKKEKEMNEKKALASAKASLEKFMGVQMALRNQDWERKKTEYMKKKMDELKSVIIKHANDELLKDESRRATEEMMRKRAERDRLIREKEAKEAAEGGKPAATQDAEGDESDGEDNWTKGTKRGAAPVERPTFTRERKAPAEEEDIGFGRSNV